MIKYNDIVAIARKLSDADGYLDKKKFQQTIASLKDKAKPKPRKERVAYNLPYVVQQISKYRCEKFQEVWKDAIQEKCKSQHKDEFIDSCRFFNKDGTIIEDGFLGRYIPKVSLCSVLGITPPTLRAWKKKGIIDEREDMYICFMEVEVYLSVKNEQFAGRIERISISIHVYDIEQIKQKIKQTINR